MAGSIKGRDFWKAAEGKAGEELGGGRCGGDLH